MKRQYTSPTIIMARLLFVIVSPWLAFMTTLNSVSHFLTLFLYLHLSIFNQQIIFFHDPRVSCVKCTANKGTIKVKIKQIHLTLPNNQCKGKITKPTKTDENQLKTLKWELLELRSNREPSFSMVLLLLVRCFVYSFHSFTPTKDTTNRIHRAYLMRMGHWEHWEHWEHWKARIITLAFQSQALITWKRILFRFHFIIHWIAIPITWLLIHCYGSDVSIPC